MRSVGKLPWGWRRRERAAVVKGAGMLLLAAFVTGGGAGGLAYFEPWGNVVMYYGDFGSYSELYELGKAVSGSEAIGELSGEVFVEAVEIR